VADGLPYHPGNRRARGRHCSSNASRRCARGACLIGSFSAVRAALFDRAFRLRHTIEFDGRPETIFGCGTIDIINSIGAPWLLGSDAIERHYRHFLRGSIFWVRKMRAEYSLLRNTVDDRNEVAKRWLAWLGFEIGEAVPRGYEQLPFRTFEMKGNHV